MKNRINHGSRQHGRKPGKKTEKEGMCDHSVVSSCQSKFIGVAQHTACSGLALMNPSWASHDLAVWKCRGHVVHDDVTKSRKKRSRAIGHSMTIGVSAIEEQKKVRRCDQLQRLPAPVNSHQLFCVCSRSLLHLYLVLHLVVLSQLGAGCSW